MQSAKASLMTLSLPFLGVHERTRRHKCCGNRDAESVSQLYGNTSRTIPSLRSTRVFSTSFSLRLRQMGALHSFSQVGI